MASGLVGRVTRHRLALRTPLVTGHGAIVTRDVLLFSVGDDQHRGYADCAPLPGWGGESLDDALDFLKSAIIALQTHKSPSSRDDVTEIVEMTSPASAPFARSTLEAALCDLAARKVARPLARFLCSAASTSVPVNALVATADQARTAADAGFETIKVKWDGSRSDLDRIAAIRRVVPGLAFRIDANGAVLADRLDEHEERLAALDPQYVEELTTPGPVPGGYAPRGNRPFAVAADESVTTLARDQLVAVADVAVLKPALHGGPLTTLRLARALEKAGVACVITSLLDSAAGVRNALAAAAALHGRSTFRLAAGLATSSLLVGDLGEPPKIVGGRAFVDQTSGNGFVPTAGHDAER